MLSNNVRKTKAGSGEFDKAFAYSQRASSVTDSLEAIRQVNFALNHYTIAIIQEMMGISDQIDELSDRLERLENSKSLGLSTTLR